MINIINTAEVNYGIWVKCYYFLKTTESIENLGDVKKLHSSNKLNYFLKINFSFKCSFYMLKTTTTIFFLFANHARFIFASLFAFPCYNKHNSAIIQQKKQ